MLYLYIYAFTFGVLFGCFFMSFAIAHKIHRVNHIPYQQASDLLIYLMKRDNS